LLTAIISQFYTEGQWTEKRDAKGSVGSSEIMAQLNAGRQRVAEAKAQRWLLGGLSLTAASNSPAKVPKSQGRKSISQAPLMEGAQS
jgi:hypothetical protein